MCVCMVWCVRDVYVHDLCVRDVCVRDVCVHDLCVRDVFVRDLCVRDVCVCDVCVHDLCVRDVWYLSLTGGVGVDLGFDQTPTVDTAARTAYRRFCATERCSSEA